LSPREFKDSGLEEIRIGPRGRGSISSIPRPDAGLSGGSSLLPTPPGSYGSSPWSRRVVGLTSIPTRGFRTTSPSWRG